MCLQKQKYRKKWESSFIEQQGNAPQIVHVQCIFCFTVVPDKYAKWMKL